MAKITFADKSQTKPYSPAKFNAQDANEIKAVVNALENGWSPVFSLVADGERRVLQVSDWISGGGDKPETGMYVGEDGYVSELIDGADVRGAAGSQWTNSVYGIEYNETTFGIGVGISADVTSRVTIKGSTNDDTKYALWLLNSDNESIIKAKNDGSVHFDTSTLWANAGGVFKGNVNTDGNIGRPSAQMVATNYGRPDLHGLISIENNYADKESALTFYAKVSDDTWRQTFSLFQSFVDYDNTVGAYHTVSGVHTPGPGTDVLNIMWWDNNSSYANAGPITILKEHTLPPDNSFVFGGEKVLMADGFAAGTKTSIVGFSFENRMGNGWARFGPESGNNLGIEIGYNTGASTAFVSSYDRTASIFKVLTLEGSDINVNIVDGTYISSNNANATRQWINQNTDTTSSSSRAKSVLTAGDRSLTLQAIHGDHLYIDRTASTILYVTQNNVIQATFGATGVLDVIAGYSVNGAAGADGTFTTVDSKTVTVSKGIITSIV